MSWEQTNDLERDAPGIKMAQNARESQKKPTGAIWRPCPEIAVNPDTKLLSQIEVPKQNDGEQSLKEMLLAQSMEEATVSPRFPVVKIKKFDP